MVRVWARARARARANLTLTLTLTLAAAVSSASSPGSNLPALVSVRDGVRVEGSGWG